jgi:hypothetical protein
MNIIQRREISSKLRMILEEVNQVFGNARTVILKAYNQALSEGFTPSEAKELLFTTVKNLSRRTVYLYLPDEAKDKKMQSVARGSLQNCSGNGDSDNNNNKQNTLQPLPRELERTEIRIPISNLPTAASQVLLNNEFAISIQKTVSSNVSKGLPSKFVLTHNGHDVISVSQDI